MADKNKNRVVSARDDAATEGTLVHTRDLDKFEIPKGQPDPRGWDVRSSDRTKIGKVEDLLFDTGERRIRYIEVALDKDVVKSSGRDYALIPIGHARLDDNEDDVIVELSGADLAGAPAYDRTRLSRDYETSLQTWTKERARRATGQARHDVSPDLSADRDAGFYSSPEYDDQRFFARGNRAGSGAADRARSTGIADRVSDAVDNVKDRIDGNPASKPGPDPTDRRI